MDDAGRDTVEQARAARAAGRLAEAAALYEEAARSGEPRARAHRLRHAGEIWLELARLDRAEAALDTALAGYRNLAAAPALELANALRPLALLREAQGRKKEARDAWAEAGRLYAEAGVEIGARESERRTQALAE